MALLSVREQNLWRCRIILKPKICFFSLGAYPYLTQRNTGTAGGAELQQVLLAKELVKNGFEISFVVRDYEQKPLEIVDGIKIFKLPTSSYSGIKTHPLKKLYFFWKTLKQIDADIYYKRAADYVTGFIVLFCLLKKKKFVYSISCQADVDGTYILKSYLKNLPPFTGSLHKQMFKFGIKRADCIIAQNAEQQKLLKKNFDKDSVLIKSMCPMPNEKPRKDIPPIVLWVSSMQKLKQPELFLELAKAIPSARFQMIGGSFRDKKFYEQIKAAANGIPNLDFVGFVPYHGIKQYFDRASIFVNTSTVEGFPNTFLQAWAGYTPVVSLNVDPDEVICEYKLGFHSRTFEQMVEDVKLLLKDEKLREVRGVNGRRYVEREHDIKKIVREYEELFQKIRFIP
jgi:glycosyltransferase involved in cell wall biosynthesis